MELGRLVGPGLTVEHRHGDEWVALERRGPHSPADVDPERGWGRGTIYACPHCDEQVRVVEDGAEPDAPG